MATLFATSPGRVAVLPENIPTGLVMAIGGANRPLAVPGQGSFPTMRAIVTDLAIEQGDDFQITSTMSIQRFVWVFGRQVGTARIAGIAFTDSCEGPIQGDPAVVEGPTGRVLTRLNSGQTGLERICDFFNASRISTSGQVYDLVLGTGVGSRWKILYHGLQITVSKPEMRLVEFTLHCKALQ